MFHSHDILIRPDSHSKHCFYAFAEFARAIKTLIKGVRRGDPRRGISALQEHRKNNPFNLAFAARLRTPHRKKRIKILYLMFPEYFFIHLLSGANFTVIVSKNFIHLFENDIVRLRAL